MFRSWPTCAARLLLVSVLCAVLATGARAGIGDAIKKVGGQASKKASETVDKTKENATPADKSGESSGTGESKPSEGSAAGGNSKVNAVSTKFDFVPGDKVLLFDDFTQDELGEFPAKWRLVQGNFETAEKAGERWLRSTSEDGLIRMKLEGSTAPPEFWTLEFDVDCEEPMSSAYSVRAIGENDALVWEMSWPVGHDFLLRNGKLFSSVTTPGENRGRHHIAIMARGKGLKMYLDNERDVNIPEINGGPITDLEIRLYATTKPMLTNVRYAEGCRPPKDMLAEGKFVTYGIRFATGSDVVLPESAPVLRQVSAWMTANPAMKLQITGHTDNVGTAASNLDLSKRRAASVAKVLSEQFAIAADRFETDGKGDTQTVASNANPEGRAMNRRVEFAKL